ncbi:MAG: hypothetical protein LBG83_08895 [Oscillospiraceae bacterium]|jgi:hypothetical protein|nr:hypothetical protein [Oscillospiraceae bacterium]
MGLVYDLNINRECEDCLYGEYDILAQKYYCTLREAYYEPQGGEPCPDIKQR